VIWLGAVTEPVIGALVYDVALPKPPDAVCRLMEALPL
jgi:hypothetical protein